jgi:hypothetical protein
MSVALICDQCGEVIPDESQHWVVQAMEAGLEEDAISQTLQLHYHTDHLPMLPKMNPLGAEPSPSA